MKSKLMCRGLALLLTVPTLGAAALGQETEREPETDLESAVLVVARRVATEGPRTTASVTRVGADEIERRQAERVSDVLRHVPGVYVATDGTPGAFSRVFTRGAASTQTLFVVDGVPQNDATTGGGYDLNDLLTDGVEAVEVLRGSYGILYGSEAIGGVVHVTSRRHRGPAGGSVLVEGGSFDTQRVRATYGFAEGPLDASLTLGHFQTHGERSRQDHQTRSALGRLGYDLTPKVRVETTGRWADSTTESPFDFATTGFLPEDPNIERTRRTASWGAHVDLALRETLDVRLATSILDLESSFENGPDGPTLINPDFVPNSGDEFTVVRKELVSHADERDFRLRGQGTWDVGRELRWDDQEWGLELTAGAEYLSQESESTVISPNFNAVGASKTRTLHTTRTDSLFGLLGLSLPDLGPVEGAYVEFGARRDDHSVFGDETSRFAGVRLPVPATGTTVRSSFGEGFRAPKPSELFDAFVGNVGLGPETSDSFDVGAEQELCGGDLVLSLTWFQLDVDDLIVFDSTATSPARPFGSLVNQSETRTRGWEAAASWELGDGFTVRGSGTIQNPRDRNTGAVLVNRARHFGSLGVSWSDGPWTVSLDGFYSGGLPNQGGGITYPEPDERAHPGRRRLVTLGASYQVTDALRVFGRVENLLDDDYVVTPTAPAGPPLGVHVGVELDF